MRRVQIATFSELEDQQPVHALVGDVCREHGIIQI